LGWGGLGGTVIILNLGGQGVAGGGGGGRHIRDLRR